MSDNSYTGVTKNKENDSSILLSSPPTAQREKEREGGGERRERERITKLIKYIIRLSIK